MELAVISCLQELRALGGESDLTQGFHDWRNRLSWIISGECFSAQGFILLWLRIASMMCANVGCESLRLRKRLSHMALIARVRVSMLSTPWPPCSIGARRVSKFNGLCFLSAHMNFQILSTSLASIVLGIPCT